MTSPNTITRRIEDEGPLHGSSPGLAAGESVKKKKPTTRDRSLGGGSPNRRSISTLNRGRGRKDGE